MVAEIFAMYLEEGETLCRVGNKLRDRGVRSPRGGAVWTVSSLRGILTNPIYTGQVYAGRTTSRPPRIRRSATRPIGRPQSTAVAPEEWIPVTTVAAIVSREHFELAAEKLSRNKSFASRNIKKNTYLLRALVSCGKCGLACGAGRCVPTDTTSALARKSASEPAKGKIAPLATPRPNNSTRWSGETSARY